MPAVRPVRRGNGRTLRAELRDVLADEAGRVVGIHHNSAQRDGKQLDVDCCLVFPLKDGRAALD